MGKIKVSEFRRGIEEKNKKWIKTVNQNAHTLLLFNQRVSKVGSGGNWFESAIELLSNTREVNLVNFSRFVIALGICQENINKRWGIRYSGTETNFQFRDCFTISVSNLFWYFCQIIVAYDGKNCALDDPWGLVHSPKWKVATAESIFFADPRELRTKTSTAKRLLYSTGVTRADEISSEH